MDTKTIVLNQSFRAGEHVLISIRDGEKINLLRHHVVSSSKKFTLNISDGENRTSIGNNSIIILDRSLTMNMSEQGTVFGFITYCISSPLNIITFV